ncbi:hypothetical protein BXZ70DRAFT_872379, partial [Cristinia sonorae]
MASNLYEVLELNRNASPEDVRKAYRRLALRTHPDRLPPDTTPVAREAATERFRLVNNAYEVLSDPKNRELYDKAGVWPPVASTHVENPAPPPPPRQSFNAQASSFFGSDPLADFQDPSFSRPGREHQDPYTRFRFGHEPLFSTGSSFTHGSGARTSGFSFTDPFVLFESLFPEGLSARHSQVLREMEEPFYCGPMGLHSTVPTASFPFGFRGGLPGGAAWAFSPFNGSSHSNVATSGASAVGERWISQSTMTRTINGRTETFMEQLDSEGNEHVRYASPEGERYMINGVERPANQRD